MTIEENYFFDTYAVMEVIGGAVDYKKYTTAGIIITKLNLFEIFYSLLKMYGKGKATYCMNQYAQFVVDFNESDIETAADLKRSNKALSMTDCIGYAVALRKGVKFLTGDKEFASMTNVEFVK